MWSFRPLARHIGLYLMDAQTKATKKWKLPSPHEVNRFVSAGLDKDTFKDKYGFRPLSRWIGLYQDIHYYKEFVDCYRPLPRYTGLYRK